MAYSLGPLIGLGLLLMSQGAASATSATYTYDPAGRLATALYDNGLCQTYTYDLNGNRTAAAGTVGGAPETSVWGAGTWGCMTWQAATRAGVRYRSSSSPTSSRKHQATTRK